MATEAPAAPPLRDRDSIPDRFKWNLKNIFADWDAWQAAYDELDRKIAAFAALQGTLGRGTRAAARRAARCATRSASSNTRCGTSRRSGTTRTSATTRSTRGGSRSRSCSPRRRRPRPGSIPSCLKIPLRDGSARGWRRARSWRSTGSRSRISTGSRSTCSTTRASTCSRCRAGSRRRRTTPMRRCRPPTSSTRR